MHASNTRSAFAPWENRLVVCDGILKSVKRKPDGSAHLLLVNCRVRAFDPDVRLSDQPFVKVDHIWDEVNDPEATPTGLLTRQGLRRHPGCAHQAGDPATVRCAELLDPARTNDLPHNRAAG